MAYYYLACWLGFPRPRLGLILQAGFRSSTRVQSCVPSPLPISTRLRLGHDEGKIKFIQRYCLATSELEELDYADDTIETGACVKIDQACSLWKAIRRQQVTEVSK